MFWDWKLLKELIGTMSLRLWVHTNSAGFNIGLNKVPEFWPNVTLHATLYPNSNSCSPLTHVRFQDPYFIFIAFLLSILTSTLDSILGAPYAQPCPTFPVPCLFPNYPDRGFHNPILDLLIPLLHSRPCIVPSSYESKPPMYSRPSLNIN